jgi:hypothetical protein
MYALYDKVKTPAGFRYQWKEVARLFGCNEGWIPWLLQFELDGGKSEPLEWHLHVPDALARNGYRDCALVIDIKPKNRDGRLHLSELIDVWGYSADGWTPLLMRTSPLLVEDDPNQYDRKAFSVDGDGTFDPVYSTLYVQGSVESGKISGKWTPPRASPTNSALLWPPAMIYFLSCIAKANPELFAEANRHLFAAEASQSAHP